MTRLRSFYEIATPLNGEPLVCLFENFLEEREIEALLAAAANQLQEALVSAASSGVRSDNRSGSNCWVKHDHDEVIRGLAGRVAEIVGLPLEQAESLQVIHYGAGQEYAPHYDAWDPATERGRRCMAHGGQRLVTCLLYLNEPSAGGNTLFPNLDLEIRPLRGRMLLFHNCHPESTVRHPDSLHGGLPVLEGEKWACNFWFREQNYQGDRTPGDRTDSQPAHRSRRVV